MRLGAATAVAAAAGLLASCGGGDSSDITVFAAASLTDAFTELADRFEHETGTGVTLSLAGSQQLVAQVGQGAEPDVVATADELSMAALDVDARTLALNRLTIVVEPGNPLGIDSVDDLDDPGITVVLAAPEVPAGRYAADVLRRAGIEVEPRSLEESVTAVVTRVALGEADAGIAYVTDATAAEAAGEVERIDIPARVNVEAVYPIAALDPDGDAFVDFALSPDGQGILADHGFLLP